MKQKFGKYAIFDTTTFHFKTEVDWWWKVKPATSGDELAMSKFMVNNRRELGPDGIMRKYPPTNIEIMHREIALTFAGTNIPADDDKKVEDGGDPILKVGDPIEIIESFLRAMPHPMVMEIWEGVGDAIPGWGPLRPKVKSSSENSETK